MRQLVVLSWLGVGLLACTEPPVWEPRIVAATSTESMGSVTDPPSASAQTQTSSVAHSTSVAPSGTVAASQAPPPEFNLDGEPVYSRATPLTNEQWANSVRDILRLPALPTQANSFLRPVGGFTTFINNERVLEVTNDMRDSYRLAAAEISAEVATDANIQRVVSGTDADEFIETFGRRAFRRPLEDAEVIRYRTLFDTGSAFTGDGTAFTKGAGLVVEAMLQSPHFLYRTELSPGGGELTGFEVASKLSFWLLNTSPSDTLLAQAEEGALSTADGVANVAEAMFDNEAATHVFTEMHAELFKFSRFHEIVKFSEEYDPATTPELEEAARLFFARVFEEGLGLREILTSTKGYAGSAMAGLYGIEDPGEMSLIEFGPERAGYFAQVPYLALFGDDDHADAIHRGLFINFQVLCAKLPKPSGEVPLPPAPNSGESDRVRMELHTGKGTCGEACHGNYINPLGYAFESFDGLGRLRSVDAGKPVDASSAYPFVSGWQSFDGAPELMSIIAESEEAHACYAKNLLSYALQRDIIQDDMPTVDALADVSKSTDGGLKTMILELVRTSAFRSRAGVTL